MTPRQSKALQALFTEPTREAAAKAAGISSRTLREYMKDAEFRAAYHEAVTAQLGEVTGQARQELSSALAVLREIMEIPVAEDKDRISAASKSIDAALKLIEKLDQQVKLDELEKWVREVEERRAR